MLCFVDEQILKPAEKKQKFLYGAMGMGSRPGTPPRGAPKFGAK